MIQTSSLLANKVCGPHALPISGTIKDVGLTYIGFIFFGDAQFTTAIGIGLALSFCGAVYIIYDKYQIQKDGQKVEAEQQPDRGSRYILDNGRVKSPKKPFWLKKEI